MKTARERAEEWLIDNDMIVRHHLDGLELLLKEQDQITRHACMDAICDCEIEYSGALDSQAISFDEAHRACMNVKAV